MSDLLDRYITWAQRHGWPNFLISTLPGTIAGFTVGLVVNLLLWRVS